MTTIDLTPARLDFKFYAGDDVVQPIRFTGDLSDRTFAASFRHGSDEPVEFDVDVVYDDDADITTVTLTLTADVVAGLPSTGRWDFQMTTDDAIRTLIAGLVSVSSQVTADTGS